MAELVANTGEPILQVIDLHCHFDVPQGGWFSGRSLALRAVDGVSFDVNPGETLGVVGESGSGKSTLARLLMQLEPLTSGKVLYGGEELSGMSIQRRKRLRQQVQMVFQDPWGSLDPRMRIFDTISEGWSIHRDIAPTGSKREAAEKLMEQVGLNREILDMHPEQLSGGQRQRVSIARALAVDPKVLILDEAISALDVSIQAQVINLLEEIQRERGLTYIFIAHDLSVVRHISDRIAVMYMGRIAEIGPAEAVYLKPRHPYTKALLSAVPTIGPTEENGERIVLTGEVPSPLEPPSGCRFRTRCWAATTQCAKKEPNLERLNAYVSESACFFPIRYPDD